MTPSPDAASVKPACPICGAVMSWRPGVVDGWKLYCFKYVDPKHSLVFYGDTQDAALDAASRPARELTEEDILECVRVGIERILDETLYYDPDRHQVAAAIRAAVARALAIVRGEM